MSNNAMRKRNEKDHNNVQSKRKVQTPAKGMDQFLFMQIFKSRS